MADEEAPTETPTVPPHGPGVDTCKTCGKPTAECDVRCPGRRMNGGPAQ